MSEHEPDLHAAREVLGVPTGADLVELRSAFRRRSMETHPDRDGSAQDFAEVRSAYALLLEHAAALEQARSSEGPTPDRSDDEGADGPVEGDRFVVPEDDDIDVRVVDEPSTPRRKGFEEMLFDALRREYGDD